MRNKKKLSGFGVSCAKKHFECCCWWLTNLSQICIGFFPKLSHQMLGANIACIKNSSEFWLDVWCVMFGLAILFKSGFLKKAIFVPWRIEPRRSVFIFWVLETLMMPLQISVDFVLWTSPFCWKLFVLFVFFTDCVIVMMLTVSVWTPITVWVS